MKKIFVTIVTAAVILTMAGCGSGTNDSTASSGTASAEASSEENASEASTEGYTAQDGPMTTASEAVTSSESEVEYVNNPVSDYSGAYTEKTGKGYSLLIQATDDNTSVYITVGYLDGEDYYIWDIFSDANGSVINYTGAICTKMVPDAEAENGVRAEEVYSDGKGMFEIYKDGSIVWTDEKVNDGEELVFLWDQELNDELKEYSSEAQN